MTRLPPEVRSALAAVHARPLDTGWQLARTSAGQCATPDALGELEWHAAEVPGTVASSLHRDLGQPGNYDADDWWYRLAFPRPESAAHCRLVFEGLATVAQAWLNGVPILESRNMFRAHAIDVTALLRDDNQLVIAFRSLDAELRARRPRPRWKTALVANQNLRWARTTLLGRIPAWTPAITPVGPWGAIMLESADHVAVSGVVVRAWAEGSEGRLQVEAQVDALAGATLDGARIRVGEHVAELAIDGNRVRGDLAIAGAPLWWPHTHGLPRRVECRLELEAGGRLFAHDCGPVGFKAVTLDDSGGQVRLAVNGVPVFCRGAVWTPVDILRLRAAPGRLRPVLEAARDAGVNMLRIGGTMAYESGEFYALCDELGILVWQDFMFANMDYPVGDAAFRAEIEAEAGEQLRRLARHACIAAYCGGSEIAQQAAMLGLPADQWCNEFFAHALPRLAAEHHPRIPYFPSTPWGGALPIHVGTGLAHYYGVGAYRRPLADVKAARVKFAAECLGFSNVPDAEGLADLDPSGAPAPHHPRWKARVPRDAGSGYDFEDVRDFYLRELFGEDPVALRARDPQRYLAVSRVASGEAMQRTFSEWRAPASGCGGALVWFYRDLWPGAGWGITDSAGRPKAAYWHLKRAWAPRTVRVTDEGLDGLGVHVLNESPAALDAQVEIEMLHEGYPTANRAATPVRVPAHGAVSLHGDAILGRFTDSTHAYRFGAPAHDVVAVRLRDRETGVVLAEDFHFPAGLGLPPVRPRVEVDAQWNDAAPVLVTLRSDAFLQSVSVDCPGFTPSDNYFHLCPGEQKHLAFSPVDRAQSTFHAAFAALNAREIPSVRAQRHCGDRPDETR